MAIQTLYLKKPRLEHLPQMVELDQICLGGIWTPSGYQRELDSPNSHLLILSILTPLEIIIGCGCFWAILEEAHITLLAIHPDYQGQGLGKLLLYKLLAEAVQRQLERATLEVRVSNQVALTLYERCGFHIAGRRKSYYRHTGEDALILWREDLHESRFQNELNQWCEGIRQRLDRENWTLFEETEGKIDTRTVQYR